MMTTMTTTTIVMTRTVLVNDDEVAKCEAEIGKAEGLLTILYVGQVGIALVDHYWAEPKDRKNADDVEAAERLMLSKLGWFANPIYGDGDYPGVLKTQLEKKAKELGLETSPLPRFTPEQIHSNRGQFINLQ